jgi:hypothetical protein
MPDPIAKLRIERHPVRWLVGLLAGSVMGPVIACLLLFSPTNDVVGPYHPPYRDLYVSMALPLVFWGFGGGLFAGLGVTFAARFMQRWKWGKEIRPLSSLEPDQAGIPRHADEHVYVPEEWVKSQDEGIAPAT